MRIIDIQANDRRVRACAAEASRLKSSVRNDNRHSDDRETRGTSEGNAIQLPRANAVCRLMQGLCLEPLSTLILEFARSTESWIKKVLDTYIQRG